ncbi:MAG: P-type conjugative transfer ATPase TrbB [Candidatus Adiutrix sp.]|jgi:type IV secretion system protein VirB11|nr:P-type conjugative transfer ATPase TrbB [Candidatus Adiutrix sp.]
MSEPNRGLYDEVRNADRNSLLESISLNLGDFVVEALQDPEVIEILLNPDGKLWIERFGRPMKPAGFITPYQADLALSFIASALKTCATPETPIIEGELPLDGSRFEGLMPPIVAAPSFAIRKKASKIFTFEDYQNAGNLTPEGKEVLEAAVVKHKNILVVGGTGSGKTTFVNAIIDAIARLTPHDRLVIIEDTSELQSNSENRIELHATDFVDMQRLLRATMRLRPDRILVGEVRDVSALALIKAWNTGHDGGVATVHANSAREGLVRIEQLIAEGNFAPIKEVLADAVHLVVFMKKFEGFRRVAEIAEVGFSAESRDYTFDYRYRYAPVEAEAADGCRSRSDKDFRAA